MELLERVSTVEAVEMQYDGRVPPALRAAAEAIDREAAARKARQTAANGGAEKFQVRPGLARLSERIGVSLMARVIAECFALRGEVAEQDLLRAGFTAAQIADWRERALSHALTTHPAMAEAVKEACLDALGRAIHA